MEPLLLEERPKNVVARLKAIANTVPDCSFESVRLRYYAARKRGLVALVDRRLAGPKWWIKRNGQSAGGLSEEDQDLVKLYCEKNQRSSRSAIKALIRDWKFGRVKTATPRDERTGRPRGWSPNNLQRYAPSKFELKSTRIGRSAAAAHRPLVYTTRQGLWVGSHIMLDDMWHDHYVNSFAEKQSGRPLELSAHDLFPAYKRRWGIRVRTRKEDGSYNQLTEHMTRFVVAATLFLDGYSPRGTIFIAEHGMAAIREILERALFEMSDGLITVARSGMTGAAAHAGVYPGISRGNSRFKASHESSHSLTHNVFADIPGQTGKDRDHQPEQLPALLRNNDNLLAARNYLSPESAALLELPLLEVNQFMQVAHEKYHAIAEDPDHDLEGWIESGLVVQELFLGGQWIDQAKLLGDSAQSQLALELIKNGQLSARPRKMTRGEVWRSGAGELQRIPGHGVCAILGDDLAAERKVRSNMFEFEDREVGPGVHRYESLALTPHGERVHLCDGETYETFVNPFAVETMFVRHANGSYIGQCQRIQKACRADVEAVQRLCGGAAKREAELLQPIRLRHLKDARDKTSRHERNAAVLSGQPLTIDERSARQRIHEAQRNLTTDDEAAILGSARDSRAAEGDSPSDSADEISEIFGSSKPTTEGEPPEW